MTVLTKLEILNMSPNLTYKLKGSLKGFWQVPLTDRAKQVSAFATPNGLYQYKVMG